MTCLKRIVSATLVCSELLAIIVACTARSVGQSTLSHALTLLLLYQFASYTIKFSKLISYSTKLQSNAACCSNADLLYCIELYRIVSNPTSDRLNPLTGWYNTVQSICNVTAACQSSYLPLQQRYTLSNTCCS
jgi:hypothetical protein